MVNAFNKADSDIVRSFIFGIEQHLGRFDHNRYNVLKKVMNSPGSIISAVELLENDYYEPSYFEQYGLLFLSEGDVIMPYEIRERLLKVDAKWLKAILDRNTEWVQLTQGLLYFYGTMGIQKLKEKVEHYTGQSVDYFEFWDVIYDLEPYDFSISYSAFGFSYFMVDDPQHIEHEHRSRPEVDYYPFTKAQVLQAAEDEYVERHEGYRLFVSFLRMHWDMDEEEADKVTADLVNDIQRGDSLSELISSLQEDLEFTDQNQLQQLLQVLTMLMNNTRLWKLKGHTPTELSREEPGHRKPLPQHSGTVYSFQTRTKVGRNDPCPCGSGKKYKKCCGA